MRIAGEIVERHSPGDDRDHEDPERSDERARVENQRRCGERHNREHDRRGASGLEQADHELAVGCDDGQIVEVVIVEAQLTERGDDRDLPQRRVGGAAVQAGRKRHRPRDENHLEPKNGQPPDRYIPIEHLHVRQQPAGRSSSLPSALCPSPLPQPQ